MKKGPGFDLLGQRQEGDTVMKKSLGLRLVRRTPSPSMVVACLALAVALSGAGYAAVTLPRNSVGTPQLKRNAVVSTKIAAGGVGTSDLKANAVKGSKARPNTLQGVDISEATLGQVPVGRERGQTRRLRRERAAVRPAADIHD